MKVTDMKNNKATVFYNGRYYCVSDNGIETLIFESDSSGKIKDWAEVGGSRGVSLSEVLSDFSSYIHL